MDRPSALADLATYLLGTNPSPSKNAENVVGIGVDIISTLLNVKAPGAGILAKSGLGLLKRQWSMRRGYLQKAVAKLQLEDTRATELTIRWIQYSMSPNEKRWRVLNDYVQQLAERGVLFLVLTHVLKAFRYGSVVILIDQAEKLVGNRTLTDSLINILAPEGSAGLNLYFVFAGTPDVEQLNSTAQYGGFFRRFLDSRQCSSIDTTLDGADISGGPADDIDRIRKVLSKLKKSHPGLPIPLQDAARVRKLRRVLQTMVGKGPVTWPMVWRLVLNNDVR
jgi:hypothetical protein